MTLGRRQFLGAMAGTAASLYLPRSAARAQETDLPAATFWGTVPVPETSLPAAEGTAASIASSGILPLVPRALAALDRHGARITARDRIAIVDFSQPSRAARFHIVDLAGGTASAPLLVAHGRGSDPANCGMAGRFSNRLGSDASS
jgi:hypothetical protein